jgi:O-antigen/teichoic acid export membrane protein
MDVQDSIAGLVSIAFAGNVMGRGLSYALNFVIATGLGPEAVGLFAFGIVIMNIGAIFARLGLDGAIRKLVPVYQNRDDSGLLTGAVLLSLLVPLIWGVFVSGLTFLILSTDIGLFNTSTSGVLFFVAAIPLLGVFRVSTRASEGFQRTEYAVITRDLIRPGIALLFAFIGSYLIKDIVISIIGYVVSIIVALIFSLGFLYFQGGFDGIGEVDFQPASILNLSIPMFLSNLGQYFTLWTDILVLGLFVPAAALGKYQIAYQTSLLLTFLLTALNSLFPSIAADLYDSGHYERLENIFESTTKWITYLTGFGYIFLIVYAKPILSLFGQAFTDASSALIIVATAQMVGATAGPVGFLLTMSEYERIELANAVSTAVLNVCLNFVLIQQYGIIGAALATAVSITTLNVLRIAEVRYFLGMTAYSGKYIFGLISLALATGVMLAVKQTTLSGIVLLAVAGVTSAVVFLTTLWIVAVDEQDYILLEAV